MNTEYCLDMNGSEEFNCICNAGFEGRRCEISLCGGVACENGFCDNGNCICESGYIKIESVCVETCALSPCQELKWKSAFRKEPIAQNIILIHV